MGSLMSLEGIIDVLPQGSMGLQINNDSRLTAFLIHDEPNTTHNRPLLKPESLIYRAEY
ncbi:MAG: hypothetical protein IPN90_01135 [Elusimicrobia bacterium]|nr:hypothetical protein [Elusimicrobiota bacterium]